MKYIGIHFDGDRFLVAVLNNKLKPLVLSSFSNSKKFKLGKKFLFQRKKFVGGLEANSVLIKKTSLKIKRRFVLKKILSLQADGLFPFGNKPSIVIPILKNNIKEQKSYILYGTTVSKIKKCINDFEEKKINLHVLSFETAAIARFANAYFPSYKSSFVVHIEESKTICVFLENGYATFSHVIKIGKNDLFQDLDPNNPFDLELIDESKKDVTSSKWVQFKSLITQAFLSIKSNEKVFLLLTGHLENVINIEKFLFCEFQNDISFFGKEKILSHEYNIMRKYAIPIGYCIDSIKNDKKSLQFIQNSCLPKKTVFSFYKKAFFFSLSAISLILASLQFQNKHTSIKTHAISQKFNSLKEFDEKEMKRTVDLSNIKTLSLQMEEFHNVILKENSFFPYFFKKLKPSSVLETILKITNDIQLKSFSYKIESCPTVNKPYDKTVIRIALTLSGGANKMDDFEKRLLDENLINSKKQLEHSFENNLHKISFYLK